MNNTYKELPSGYKLKKYFSLKEISVQIIINLIALLIMIIPIITILIFNKFEFVIPNNDRQFLLELLIAILVLIVGIILVLFLHEIIHAIFYKKYTKENPKVVINFQELSLKVENVYIKKKETIIIMLTPLILSLILFIPTIIFPLNMINIALILVFSSSLAIASDDLYTILAISEYSKEALYIYSNKIISIYDVE